MVLAATAIALVVVNWFVDGQHLSFWLQFAGTTERVRSLLEGTNPGDLAGARRAVWIDFALVASYTILFVWVTRVAPRLSKAPEEGPAKELMTKAARAAHEQNVCAEAKAFTLLALTAGALDVVENALLLWLLSSPTNEPLSVAASAVAWPKWLLLFFVLLYCARVVVPPIRSWASVQAMSAAVPKALAAEPEGVERLDGRVEAGQEGDRPLEIGVCCSGGGIRSAAYNLGALQALQATDLWSRVKYITAVSGGSYIAGARQILLSESNLPDGDDPPFSTRSPEERYLRNHTNYLAPTALARWGAFFRWWRGLMANLLFLAALLWVVARPVGWLVGSRFVYSGLQKTATIFTPTVRAATLWSLLGLVAAAVVVAFIPQVTRQKTEAKRNRFFRYSEYLLFSTLIIFVLFFAVPFALVAGRWLVDGIGGVGAILFGSLAALGVGAAAVRSLLSPYAGRIAKLLASLAVPLLVASVFLLIANQGALRWLGWYELVVMASALLVAGLLGAVDVSLWSLHPFYKRKLADAYALRRESAEAMPVPFSELKWLSETGPAARGPSAGSVGGGEAQLIVCAAANVSRGAVTPPGRDSLSFTFAYDRVGMADTGVGSAMCDTTTMEAALGDSRREDMTLIAAVGVSGAAVSPSMGRRTMRSLQALLAVFNIRLGLWLPNPVWIRHPPTGDWRPSKPRVFPYLLKEILGVHALTDEHLYITDGGHWDNLGLVELLRRRCRLIFCLDASGDSATSFFTIGEAISLARTELECVQAIELNPNDMRPPPPTGKGQPVVAPKDHIVGTIRYTDAPDGVLIYCKAAVTTHAPWDVRAFQERNPRFPNDPTLTRQFFDDERFEAYRALGHTTAGQAHETACRELPEICNPEGTSG